MSRVNIFNIKTKEINLSDNRFTIAYGQDLEKLIESIKTIGLINPPVLMKSEKNYQVICGYKRVLACQKLNFREIAAVVYNQGELDELKAFQMNIYDNITIRELNPIEKAEVINRLLNVFKVNEGEIIQKYLSLISLQPNRNVFKMYLSLIDLEDEIKHALIGKTIVVRTAIELKTFVVEDRLKIFNFMLNLKMGTNKQQEIITYLKEIHKRDNVSIGQILSEKELSRIIEDKKLTIPQKANKARWFLRKKRYPKLIEAEKHFAKKLKELKLSPEITITPPPYFESDEFELKFKFKNPEDIKKLGENLQEISKSEILKDLLG